MYTCISFTIIIMIITFIPRGSNAIDSHNDTQEPPSLTFNEMRQLMCLFPDQFPGGGGPPIPGGGGPPIPGGGGPPIPAGLQTFPEDFNNSATSPQASIPSHDNGLTLQSLCIKCNIETIDCNCQKQNILCNFTRVLNEALNNLTSHLDCSSGESIRITKASFNVVSGLVGFFGNMLVIIITCQSYGKCSRCHYLIGGLALSDFVFSFLITVKAIPELWTCKWLYSAGTCKGLFAVLDLSQTVGIGFIFCVALERYVGILHTMNKWFTNTMLSCVVAGVCVLGFAATIPTILVTKGMKIGSAYACKEYWPGDTEIIYTWILFFLYFVLPVAVTSYMYVRIIFRLKAAASEQIRSMTDNQMSKRLKDNRRILKVLISILIAFVVLVFPLRLVWIIIVHVGRNNMSRTAVDVITLVGFIPYSMHTAINPIIYSIIDVKFQEKVKKLLGCQHIIKKPKTVAYSTANSSEVELKVYSPKSQRGI